MTSPAPSPPPLPERALHIHSGDSAAHTLAQSGVPGEQFAWRDPLLEGPTPAVGDDVWLRTRAEYWVENPYIPVNDPDVALRSLEAMEETLARYGEFEEVVLWFDACLYDHAILLHILDWFANRDLGETRLSLVYVGEFPGYERFNGLGELTPDNLASLVPSRRSVNAAQFALAQEAWAAYRSDDPRDVERLVARDLSALPYLEAALRRHLERFPAADNGLNRLQRAALTALIEGPRTFAPLFVELSGQENPVFCGDTYVAGELHRLQESVDPAIRIEGLTNPPVEWTIHLTELGRRLVAGETDWVERNSIDRWLGGVHLHGEIGIWRWDRVRQRLVRHPDPEDAGVGN